jgi:hypothetical protein
MGMLVVTAQHLKAVTDHRALISEPLTHIDVLDEKIERLSADFAQRLRP